MLRQGMRERFSLHADNGTGLGVKKKRRLWVAARLKKRKVLK
jgi:hypothetical protein